MIACLEELYPCFCSLGQQALQMNCLSPAAKKDQSPGLVDQKEKLYLNTEPYFQFSLKSSIKVKNSYARTSS